MTQGTIIDAEFKVVRQPRRKFVLARDMVRLHAITLPALQLLFGLPGLAIGLWMTFHP